MDKANFLRALWLYYHSLFYIWISSDSVIFFCFTTELYLEKNDHAVLLVLVLILPVLQHDNLLTDMKYLFACLLSDKMCGCESK